MKCGNSFQHFQVLNNHHWSFNSSFFVPQTIASKRQKSLKMAFKSSVFPFFLVNPLDHLKKYSMALLDLFNTRFVSSILKHRNKKKLSFQRLKRPAALYLAINDIETHMRCPSQISANLNRPALFFDMATALRAEDLQ